MSTNFDYQKSQNELDQIMSDIQSGNLSIDESLEKYERAELIIGQLEKYLKTVENKISKINQTKES